MDKRQITQLYETFGQDVYRLALSYLHSSHDAEDICQSVFLKLLEKNVQLLPGKEKAWLLTCAANACKNQLKSFWHKNRQPLDEGMVFKDRNDREIWDAVGRIPSKYRAVIHLYYYEGYTQEEIAQILGITRTAVQTRVSRARKLLEKELKVYE